MRSGPVPAPGAFGPAHLVPAWQDDFRLRAESTAGTTGVELTGPLATMDTAPHLTHPAMGFLPWTRPSDGRGGRAPGLPGASSRSAGRLTRRAPGHARPRLTTIRPRIAAARSASTLPGPPAARSASAAPGSPTQGQLRPRLLLRRRGQLRRPWRLVIPTCIPLDRSAAPRVKLFTKKDQS
jgi:hypothetical protein